MSIAICTPWRDHPELADDFFGAVEVAQPDQLVIVDDGSTVPLTIAATRIEASGFCTASNAGLALVETDMVLFMNNDIAAKSATWLAEIVAQVEKGKITGPLRFEEHGKVDGVQYPYVDGWCAAMLTEDARKLGGWDEAYDQAGPAYFSDNALSFDARWAGMTLKQHRPALTHKSGQTGGSGPAFQNALKVNRAMFEAHVRDLVGG